jgi:hypothetical protein
MVEFGVFALLVELGGANRRTKISKIGLINVFLPIVSVSLFAM